MKACNGSMAVEAADRRGQQMSSRRRATRALARLALAVGLASSSSWGVSASAADTGVLTAVPLGAPVTNGAIAFVSGRDSSLPKTFTMGADGSNLTCLMCDPPGGDSRTGSDPSWSPDGTKILFERNFNIWVMNADGSGQVVLTDSLTSDPVAGIRPAWSPDGRRIAYSAFPSTDWEVFVADLVFDTNGSPIEVLNPFNLTQNPASDLSATWSAEGRIAWSSDRSGNLDIFIADATAGAPAFNLTNNPEEDYAPDFSPDGQRIVFGSTRDAFPTGEIYVMDASGANVKRLSTNAFSDGEPAFSPDGTRIVFHRFLPAGLDIFVMDAVRLGGGANGRCRRGRGLGPISPLPSTAARDRPLMFPIVFTPAPRWGGGFLSKWAPFRPGGPSGPRVGRNPISTLLAHAAGHRPTWIVERFL